MVFSLVLANMFFFFLLIVSLNFLIPAVFTEIVIEELAIPTEILTKEATGKIEIIQLL